VFAHGRLTALADVRIRFWPLALVGLVSQLVLFAEPVASQVGSLGPLLYVGSTLLVVGTLAANIEQPGFRYVAAGALLNLAAIVGNGGQMPAAPEAMAIAHGLAAVPVAGFSNSVLIGPDTWLPWLGDIFALPRGIPLANVFSIGDVLIGAGGAFFLFRTMRGALGAAGQLATAEVRALPSS
jgi:hypothetical protein